MTDKIMVFSSDLYKIWHKLSNSKMFYETCARKSYKMSIWQVWRSGWRKIFLQPTLKSIQQFLRRVPKLFTLVIVGKPGPSPGMGPGHIHDSNMSGKTNLVVSKDMYCTGKYLTEFQEHMPFLLTFLGQIVVFFKLKELKPLTVRSYGTPALYSVTPSRSAYIIFI